MADALKAEGNKAFAAKNFPEAIDKFSQAIDLDSGNHVLYSNRSGAYASMKDFDKALEDANRTTELKPEWAKGWGRKGAALHGQGSLIEALDAFEKALELEPTNAQAKAGRDAVQRAIEVDGGSDKDPLGGMGNMFNDPNLITKLANNPKTSKYLSDHQFMSKLQGMGKNPQSAMQDMFGDPRMMDVMSVLLGIDMSFGKPPDSATGEPSQAKEAEEDVPMPDAGVPPERKAAREPESELEPEDGETLAAKKAKEEAEAEKKLGTENYKKRQFDAAIGHYSKAWELHKDITYLTNLSAAKFENGDYQGAIEACEKAIAEGRETLSDFKIIAKAFGRIGTSYERMGDMAKAIENYQKSLTEHRTPDILAKLKAAEKAQIQAEKDAYIDPAKAEEAREQGNKKFKEADWPGAVDAYSEMVKRAPEDPRGYSNRAAAFIKLMAFPSAVQDCDEATKLDPKFVRAFIRKAQALLGMKEYNRCMDALDQATKLDTAGANTREIQQTQQKAMEAQFTAREGESEEQAQERIQRDPEIMSILQDPVMQSILQQAKGDPAALSDHMKNSDVRSKIQKLIAAGVIRVGR